MVEEDSLRRHELFPNEKILNVIFPNVKIPKLRKNPETPFPELVLPVRSHQWHLTGKASFWLTEMRERH
jgi:hypothetical protein